MRAAARSARSAPRRTPRCGQPASSPRSDRGHVIMVAASCLCSGQSAAFTRSAASRLTAAHRTGRPWARARYSGRWPPVGAARPTAPWLAVQQGFELQDGGSPLLATATSEGRPATPSGKPCSRARFCADTARRTGTPWRDRVRARSGCPPPSAMPPSETSSRPAIRRSMVDFPQPDGLTKTTNSLS